MKAMKKQGTVSQIRIAIALLLIVLLSLFVPPADAIARSEPPPNLYPDQIPNDETAPAVFSATFETTQGTFVIEAHRDWAPTGVDRFYTMVKYRFFDDSRFFRIRAGFIAQFGIAGEPRTATAWRNRTISDDPVKQSNKRGTVAFAMTGPNTRTTQIYINLADNSRLDAQGFAPIGTVVAGMDTVDKLYSGYDEASGGGMRGGKQDRLFAEGNKYLDKEFPRLDKLLRVKITATSNKKD
jgi:cyclophilin family peptidyl-prolyl cis-trans isomerase